MKAEQCLVQGFRNVAAMADRLGLVATIQDRANEIYKRVNDARSRGRNLNAILPACLYIACRMEGNPRTLKEIYTVVKGATLQEMSKAVKYIEQLGIEMNQPIEMSRIRAADFLKRFCYLLGMKFHEIKAAEAAVRNAEELDIRRSPTTVAAAVIYMITQLSTDKKHIRDIVQVTKVVESTIRSSYKDIYPHAAKIIPASYANKEDLKKLWCPQYGGIESVGGLCRHYNPVLGNF